MYYTLPIQDRWSIFLKESKAKYKKVHKTYFFLGKGQKTNMTNKTTGSGRIFTGRKKLGQVLEFYFIPSTGIKRSYLIKSFL